jgi:hypothetical protein
MNKEEQKKNEKNKNKNIILITFCLRESIIFCVIDYQILSKKKIEKLFIYMYIINVDD